MKTVAEMAALAAYPYHPPISKHDEKWLEKYTDLVREQCAEVCEDHFSSDGAWCAEQIRNLK